MATLPGVYSVPGAAWPGSVWIGDVIPAAAIVANPVLFSLGYARNGSRSGGPVLTQAATSSPYLQVQVIATLYGNSYDPTSDVVQVAFVPLPNSGSVPNPVSGQWNTAGWETDSSPAVPAVYWASILTGPAPGGVALAAGAYKVAVQVTDSPSVPVLWGPILVIS